MTVSARHARRGAGRAGDRRGTGTRGTTALLALLAFVVLPGCGEDSAGVRVEEDTVQRVGAWWESRWAIIALVAAGIGAAVLALLRFGPQLADQTRQTVAACRGDKEDDDEPESTGAT